MSGKEESFAKIPTPEKKGDEYAMAKIPTPEKKEQAFARVPSDSEAETVVDTDNIRQILQQSGFVRVDGLVVQTVDGRRIQIQRSFAKKTPELWGNNGIFSVRFLNGEVWVALGSCMDEQSIRRLEKSGLLKREGFYVPLSNGETPSAWDLYRRWRKPDWVPEYIYGDLSWRP